MSIQNQKLRRMFDSDSAIMMETLSRMLSGIEPGSLDGPEVDRAFRAAHSIKSEAGFMNLVKIAEAADRLEDALSEVRRESGRIDQATADSLRRGVRLLADALVAYRGARTESGDATRRGLESDEPDEHDRHRAAERGMLRESRQRGEHLYRVTVSLQAPAEMRYARAFLVMNNLELSCAVIRSEPALDDLAAGRAQAGTSGDRLTMIVTSPEDEQSVRRSVARAVHVDEVELVELSELGFDELLADPGGATGSADAATRRPGKAPGGPVGQGNAAGFHEELTLYADEILAAADRVADDESSSVQDGRRAAAEQVRAYARFMRERVGSTARVQLLDLFRELKVSSVSYAARHRKRVRVVVGGNGAFVSSAVGDVLLEAVMHLIRNSIDHGVGTLDERVMAGRPPSASIKVRVDQSGRRVRVVLQDDGTGIDEQAVRERAGDETSELLDVLARPGFSTRATPGSTSGRGVGLDNVVHSVRTLLAGEMKLINKHGSGMTFVIQVPASGRLVNVLFVRSGEALYAVPSACIVSRSVLEKRRLKRDSFGSLYYEHDGGTLILSTVSGRFPGSRGLADGAEAIVVRAGAELRVLVADAVLAEEAVVREDARARRVYSRSLGRDATFIFPASLWIGTDG